MFGVLGSFFSPTRGLSFLLKPLPCVLHGAALVPTKAEKKNKFQKEIIVASVS